jgi:hypothetical protein
VYIATGAGTVRNDLYKKMLIIGKCAVVTFTSARTGSAVPARSERELIAALALEPWQLVFFFEMEPHSIAIKQLQAHRRRQDYK